ncbi:aspartate/ornithine carbamoyltransferase carbamoyl-P binding domain [Paenibacillus curdlanolyticus YK9]|uniref:Aspartate/ornithine carbamoyltransferase carbamoyl-P binding domain n=1 Tax=Paenibacillus curdlanolyticus YK9 TaxID=717606 RepID=E0IA92_9BACL|nr:aspartate/ornithine carbamoyltransferase [Paenibacillus curdlanolyticus]EFM10669.1 aspartate/ornithine carbamoyltransferase carbamoyl-P binding domain [Paenibacillus curdlanolyticus YK9]
MNHLLSLKELSKDALQSIILTGIAIKKNPRKYNQACERKGLIMLFQKTSTRTNLSFQSAINQLGGYAVTLDWDASNFSISPIQYEARYVSSNSDMIMARLKKHADLLELAKYAKVPVINGCCDKYHPCQALADLMTVYEIIGTFSGVTITYVGIHNNVANSLIAGCVTLGIKLLLVTPIINGPSWDEELMRDAYASGYVENVDSLTDAAARSDFVYTDTWIDMEFFHEEHYQDEKNRRLEQMLPFQLNKANLRGHTPYIMHDMPVHPGFEIEEELIESERSVIYQQAENRMHVQKALLLYLLTENSE